MIIRFPPLIDLRRAHRMASKRGFIRRFLVRWAFRRSLRQYDKLYRELAK